MEQQYTLSKGWYTATIILIPLLLAGSVYLGIAPYVHNLSGVRTYLFPLLSIVAIFFLIIGLLDTKSKTIIDNEKITAIRVFKTRVLYFDEIEGFKQNENYLFFIPKEKKAGISVTKYVGQYYDLLFWTYEKFEDLDRKEKREEKQAILRNEKYGNTAKERVQLYKKAKKITKITNWIGYALGLATFIYPYFYNTQIILCIVFPLIGVAIHWYFKGIVIINEYDNSDRPGLIGTIVFPAFVLTLRVWRDENILNYSHFWVPFTLIGLTLFIVLMQNYYHLFSTEKLTFFFSFAGIGILSAVYACGFILSLNVMLDKKLPISYNVHVISKREYYSKGRKCYVQLDSWGPQQKAKEMRVNSKKYDAIKAKDTVEVRLHQGFYKIPYYYVKVKKS